VASYVQEHNELDELTEASNAVVDMVQAGNLDVAEQAAYDLLARFPDVHDGYDRLGMVCEARGDHRQAADYYRKAITVVRNHPDAYDPEFVSSSGSSTGSKPRQTPPPAEPAGPSAAPASSGARRRQGIHACGAEPP
jgi:tetratricopeptide (TPR) repeat protein